MIKKMSLFVVLALLAAPFVSLAQSPAGPGKSIQDLSATDVADDSIVVLSKEDTGVPGYVRQQYAFNCFGELQLIDYYGAPLDPKDPNVLRVESQMCSARYFGDSGSED
jgi:hypothetical protein